MKGTLMFNLRNLDDKHDFRIACKAGDMYLDMQEMYRVSRNCLKYGGKKEEALEEIRKIAGEYLE